MLPSNLSIPYNILVPQAPSDSDCAPCVSPARNGVLYLRRVATPRLGRGRARAVVQRLLAAALWLRATARLLRGGRSGSHSELLFAPPGKAVPRPGRCPARQVPFLPAGVA